jgi:hypothetical protein
MTELVSQKQMHFLVYLTEFRTSKCRTQLNEEAAMAGNILAAALAEAMLPCLHYTAEPTAPCMPVGSSSFVSHFHNCSFSIQHTYISHVCFFVCTPFFRQVRG